MKTPSPTKAELSAPSKRNFSSRSSVKEAQIQRLLEHLARRPHHTHELRKIGISHPAGRVHDLEKRGYGFEVASVTTVDSDGYPHRGVALYTLTGVPESDVHLAELLATSQIQKGGL